MLYKSENMSYNATDGGDGSRGIPMPETTRDALRKANTGRICTEETRKKIKSRNHWYTFIGAKSYYKLKKIKMIKKVN